MGVAENKQVASDFFEQFFNQRQVAVIDKLVTEDFIDHSPHSQQGAGAAGLQWLNAMLHEICPDLRFDIEAIIGEGDVVAVRNTLRGIMDDGDPLEERALVWLRFREGRIAERWSGLMR